VRATAPGTNTYGIEDCTIAAITAASTPAGSNVGGGIYFGAVPFRSLNIPVGLSVDGWNNKINYAVTKNLTLAGTASGQFGNTTDGRGGVEIRTGILEQPCSSASCQIVADPAATPVPTGAAYTIFSNGGDQRGAISMRAAARNACVVNANDGQKVDTQNCINADGSTITVVGGVTAVIPRNVFFDGRFNNGLAIKYYFDDYIIWRPRSQL
jgi:hypothetical protein